MAFDGVAAGFGYVGEGDEEDDEGERDVDEEDPAPGKVFDEPAAKEGAEDGCYGGGARPCADGSAMLVLREDGVDYGEAAGYEERAADALEGASQDEHSGTAREAAPDRGQGENDDAEGVDAPPAEAVAER